MTIIVFVIYLYKCFPHSNTHTLMGFSELLCHIAERSCKHRRHCCQGAVAVNPVPEVMWWEGSSGSGRPTNQDSSDYWLLKKMVYSCNACCTDVFIVGDIIHGLTESGCPSVHLSASAANWTRALCIKTVDSHWSHALVPLY